MTNEDPNRNKFDDERTVRVTQSNDSNGGAIALAFFIAVLLIGGIVFFMNPGTDTTGQQVTQNNAPVTEPLEPVPLQPAPVQPAPADPAADPAIAPVTPATPPAN